MADEEFHRCRVLHVETLANNVKSYVIEKPNGFTFRPGQALEFAIDEPKWKDEPHPFTLTSLPDDPRLEFVIKSYPVAENPGHDGMTEHLGNEIKAGDHVLIGDAWGAIEYRGPGVFLAGGAGMTPFIAILRQLQQQGKLAGNRLFFSNRKAGDVFLQSELMRTLGDDAVFTLTGEENRNYQHGRIDRKWLENRVKNFDQPFYLCGPPKMVEDLSEVLKLLGADADSLVFEE